MAAVEPDFLSLVEDRFQPRPSKAGVTSPKAQARLQERKKAYWNETICLRLVPAQSSSSSSGENDDREWNVPRFRLTESFLHETVNRAKHPSSPMLLVSHIHDRKTNTVILPKNLQAQCQSTVVYHVIVRSAVQVEQGGVLSGDGDSYYSGDLIFNVRNVPNLSESERFEVVPDDVHRWLVSGAINGIEAIKILSAKVENLHQTLQQLERDTKNINAAPIYNERGRAIVGSPLKDAREAKFKFLQDEMKQTKKRIIKAQHDEDKARARHFSACSLLITKQSGDGQDRTDASAKTSFSMKVMGKKKEYYKSLIRNATDWNLVDFYATGDRTTKAKSKKKAKANDEGKGVTAVTIAEADRAEHLVDVGAVSIQILPDGFGVHEAYAGFDPFPANVTGNNGESKGVHRLYHGHFREGQYHEGTMHSDSGVYSGTFLSNEPRRGAMKYSDGIELSGDFVMPPERKGNEHREDDEEEEEFKDGSALWRNPYRRGAPHKNVHIQFKDGASYQGEMHHGGVTGRGIYRYPRDGMLTLVCGIAPPATKRQDFVKIEGEFNFGMLENNDGIEGRGGSNLLRSLMFDGERSWGP